MNKVEKALAWLKKGGLIVLVDDDDREAEGDLVGLAEHATKEMINFMVTHGRGLICAPLSEEKARQLALHEMVTENSDTFKTAFTVSVDHIQTSTGISASDRARTIRALADPNAKAIDFHRPGHVFPLIAKSAGLTVRRGHTEAAIELAKLAECQEAAYICEILADDGTMARKSALQQLANNWKLPFLTVEELAAYSRFHQETSEIVQVKLPTAFGDFDLQLFEDEQSKEQLLLSKNLTTQTEEPLPVRIHSECFTGDVLGSHRCDCGEQLHMAMNQIEREGRGAIVYLRQEGRGIGLKNKLRAYQLQEKGLDTYQANQALGFLPDERNYISAAKILKQVGIKKIKLLTNNPDKVSELAALGIEVVERIPLETIPVSENKHYLKTKKEKFHHYLTV